MKKGLPAEVFIKIASYLNQINQKECCLVCKAWRQPFQSVIFQKAVITTPQQLQSYSNQDVSLRRQTHQLHFNVPLSDEALEEFAIASPHVHTLTLFINLLNQLSIPKTISVIQKYWLNSLVKVRMDELLLPKVLTFLSHQLEDVTGNYEGLFSDDSTGATRAIIPMPKLKVLDVEGDGEETILTAKILNDMRAAYPQLKKLTVSYFSFGSITEQEQAQLVPFPLVRSFHVLNCVDHDNHYPQITSMFIGLQETSFLRSTNMEVENTLERQSQYFQIVNKHPNLHEFNVDYLFGRHIIPQDTYYFARSLKFLTATHLELPSATNIITKRQAIDISIMISILTQLKKLKIWGLCHIDTGESFEHYLSGTVGYYNLEGREQADIVGIRDTFVVQRDTALAAEVRQILLDNLAEIDADAPDLPKWMRLENAQRMMTSRQREFYQGMGLEEEEEEFHTEVLDDVVYESRALSDGTLFGNGEKLIKNGIFVTTIKKRLPRWMRQGDDNHYLQWQVDEIPRFQVWFKDDIKTYGLKVLHLEMATIRTPSFYWLTKHCPLLEELHVLQTEPYPTCQIYLGDRLHTFSLSLDARYEKYKLPFVCLFDQDYNEKCLEYVSSEKKFMETESANYINTIANIYKIEIEYKPELRDLTICGKKIKLT